MNIAIIQLNVTFKAPHANAEAVAARIKTAMQKKPDVIVLPELWSCGFVPTPIAPYVDDDGRATQKFLGSLAAQYHVNIVGGSTPVLDHGKIYNRCYVFNRNGDAIAHYDKTHLFSFGGEDKIFSKGEELMTFSLDGITAGIAICYDLRFPEVFRQLALAGCQMIFLPAAWPLARLNHWLPLLQARAIENQIYLIACNAAGIMPSGKKLAGNSALLNPWGESIRANEAETILYGKYNENELTKIRHYMSIYNDRRPDLYTKSIHRY